VVIHQMGFDAFGLSTLCRLLGLLVVVSTGFTCSHGIQFFLMPSWLGCWSRIRAAAPVFLSYSLFLTYLLQSRVLLLPLLALSGLRSHEFILVLLPVYKNTYSLRFLAKCSESCCILATYIHEDSCLLLCLIDCELISGDSLPV
jgi:hypothetical protein